MEIRLESITRVAIYPPIGVARVGNSAEYYLASDLPGVMADAAGGFKDGTGRVKKQVVRFRIYGFDKDDQVVAELTANNAEIEWRVHVANRKSAWYQFSNALDLSGLAIPSAFRNVDVKGKDRHQLVIDPGPRRITGRNASGPAYQFSGGKFYDTEVPLGEIRTDELGRLLVFGGEGHSASHTGAPAVTFANNDGWHDDVSDGPVRATVKLGNAVFQAEPAVVVCTPPNFGQGLFGVVTLYDVAYDLFVREGWLKAPAKPNFEQHIYPIFERMSQTGWVNAGFFMLFGKNSPSDFTDPILKRQLADPSAAARPLRERYYHWLRQPGGDQATPTEIPPFYGDGFGDYIGIPQDDLALTATQCRLLEQWAAGDFTTEVYVRPTDFNKLPLDQQIAALCAAPLEECLGGPFHPGIEITWPLRCAITWAKPFRPKILPEGEATRDDFGPLLAPAIALTKGGPLDGNGPGSMSRWLGVPWQTDEASCLSGYTASNYLPLPSFWAARVPNQVLSAESLARLSDPHLNPGQRQKHFDYRQDWMRDLGTQYQSKINNMIAEWHELGIIAPHTEPTNEADPALPTQLWAETGRGGFPPDPTYAQVLTAENARPMLRAAVSPVAARRKAKSFGRGER